MSEYLVTVTKVAEVEVDAVDARKACVAYGWVPSSEISSMTDREVVELYISYVEGNGLDLDFDRLIHVVDLGS